MRLIDADALKAKCGEWYTEEGMEEGFIGTLGSLLDAAATVPAIPVEWLEWRIAHSEREGFGAVVSMLRTVRDWWNDQRDVWEREQETK
jgi:hypothetical protein